VTTGSEEDISATPDFSPQFARDNRRVRGTTKTVTVMFTDLVNSTEFAERLGLNDATKLRELHFASLRDSMSVHRGSEVKSMGDGIMAVFESVIDGVGCAVTMQRAVARHNRREPERQVGMRVGISVGEAVFVDGDWHGAPVVEASRLCSHSGPGEIFVSDLVRILSGTAGIHRLAPLGELELKGISIPTVAWAVDWDAQEEFALRVALADDSVLLREGVASALQGEGIDVVLQASDAETVMRALDAVRPHVVVLDVRMPPTHTTEGLDAAELIRAEHPEIGVLVLSASVDPFAARRLLKNVTYGVGYLLKDRVADMGELTTAIRTVASGGSAIDPEVLARLA
jgi:class 3 adenylate cyclase/ActR/RegA family two-component response regulator